jgi:ATP-dependent exoDNAse (exonuclease V) beta subunit
MTGVPPTTSPPALADAADRHRISAGALDRTLFVEAGAGTGKTSQLVERICNLVVHEGVALPAIAAITFTEAAAAELQNRVRMALEERRRQATSDHDRARCEAALADADRTVIATLHGFASRLLSEFDVRAGLPPSVRVLDEVASQLAAEQRWHRFVDELYADPGNEVLLERAALLRVPIEPQFEGQVTLRQVADDLGNSWDLLEPVATRPLPPLGPIDLAPLRQAVAGVEAILDTCSDPTDTLFVRLVDLVESVRAVLGSEPAWALYAVRESQPEWKKFISGRGKKGTWTDVEAARGAGKAVSEVAAELLMSAADEVLQHLLVRTARFVLESAEQRRRDGGLEFHDLLVLARDLLRTDAMVRDDLHRRYTHLLLDEFQDTDPIQIELATRIAAAVAAPAGQRWNEHDTADGSLFFVGDPKQSIYRFRRADIELFLEARDRFGSGEGLARLTTNFRTVEPVLDWVNAFFGANMADEIPGRQSSYEPLHAHRRADSGADHRPLLLGGPHPDPKVSASALREVEAEDVATTVAAILARPAEWPVHDPSADGSWRPARPDDITVLLPTRTSLPFLRDALDRHGVAYRLATGTLVYDTPEVRDILAVLRAIDDPGDELSLVAALRSPLYACSDVDLLTFRQAGGRWDLRADPPAALPDDHPVPAACRHLLSLHEQRWWRSPSALIAALLEERHGWLLAFGAPRPDDVWRRLRFLVDQALLFEEAGGAGLRGFVEWAALQGADGGRVHEPMLPETDEAAIRIMTIHGAKGLEFPITVLSGLTSAPAGNRHGVSLLWNAAGTPELSINSTLRTAGHQLRADLEAEMDAEEKLRLLYVATTRARDHLILSAHHKTDTTVTYARQLWEFAAGTGAELVRRPASAHGSAEAGAGRAGAVDPVDPAPVIPPGADVAADVDPPVDEPVVAPPPAEVWAERERWQAERAALLAPFEQPSVVSATAMADLVHGAATAEPLVDEDDDGADLDAAADTDRPFARRRGRAGTAVGQAVHGTLEAIDLRAPTAVSDLVRRQCALGAIGRLESTVGQLVRSALGSDAVRLASTNRHHKELYVAAPIGDRVIEGYVDLLIETTDGLVVVDYKTDSVSSDSEIDAKLDRYELQAASYAVALEAVTGMDVVECRFVFCRPKGAVERSVRDLAGAKARVRAALGG